MDNPNIEDAGFIVANGTNLFPKCPGIWDYKWDKPSIQNALACDYKRDKPSIQDALGIGDYKHDKPCTQNALVLRILNGTNLASKMHWRV